MTIGFLQAAVLFGLAGLTIPVLIHLWNRRRAPVVDWGAMQFLQMQPAQKRRLLLEEILLLLLRLAVVALIVLALAGPIARGPAVAAWTRPPRDVVFVIDAAARMARRDAAPNPWSRATRSLAEEVAGLGPKDRWSLIVASRPLGLPFDGFRSTRETVDWNALETETALTSRPNGPAAVARAWKLLDERGQNRQREIVLLSDGLRNGWADPLALAEWERLAPRWSEANPESATTLRYRAVSDGLDPQPINYSLRFLSAPRPLVGVGQRVRFFARASSRALAPPPSKTRLIIDDERIREDDRFPGWDVKLGQGDVQFDHVFQRPGRRHVRLELEPPEQGGRPLDAFPHDNHCDVVVQIVADYPVLIVDGAEKLTPDSPAFFLLQAFADPLDKSRKSLVVPRRVAWNQLRPEDLAAGEPRVVILADVPSFTSVQAAALDRYVRDGGAVVVLLGPRVRPDAYADLLARGDSGWMPFRLSQIAAPATAIGIDEGALRHPALLLFRSEGKSALANLRFARWWQGTLNRENAAAVSARLANGDPWLIATTVGQGNVLVSTVPFDRSWDNNLAASWEFPVLAHELIFSLAQGSESSFNLAPGEPIRVGAATFAPPLREPALPLAGTLERAAGAARPVVITSWPGLVDAPGPSGVYRLRVGDRAPVPFVVSDIPNADDEAQLTIDDKRRLSGMVPMVWDQEARDADPTSIGQAELGRWFFVGLLAVLCLESWLARRMAGTG